MATDARVAEVVDSDSKGVESNRANGGGEDESIHGGVQVCQGSNHTDLRRAVAEACIERQAGKRARC